MRFIDLFAGLGGFHVALEKLGHECVFASEKDDKLRHEYLKNFGIKPAGDIRKVFINDIPKHDILCAGFPCQPFSKAGAQSGLDDFDRGTLFDDISRILKYRRPKYFILENVANLQTHDSGRTFAIILETLIDKLGYNVEFRKLSPHQFGVPQIRERIFIVGSRKSLKSFAWPKFEIANTVESILETDPLHVKQLPERESECLDIWQEFLDRLPKGIKLPSFPIWAMEFGADYPYTKTIPFNLSQNALDTYYGAFGQSLHGMQKRDQLERIPKYARGNQAKGVFPSWKIRFIKQNREFFEEYKKYVLPIIPKIQKLPPSWQKFEWNCQGEDRVIRKHIIQFRGSGVRVKRTNYFPSLVASTSTQIPIIGWKSRYITIKEASKLQSLDSIDIGLSDGAAFKALGNAVNAKIVEKIGESLVGKCESPLEQSIA